MLTFLYRIPFTHMKNKDFCVWLAVKPIGTIGMYCVCDRSICSWCSLLKNRHSILHSIEWLR